MGGQGYEQTTTPEDADMILLNTCHIREKAAEKTYSELGRLKHLKVANPGFEIWRYGLRSAGRGRRNRASPAHG